MRRDRLCGFCDFDCGHDMKKFTVAADIEDRNAVAVPASVIPYFKAALFAEFLHDAHCLCTDFLVGFVVSANSGDFS